MLDFFEEGMGPRLPLSIFVTPLKPDLTNSTMIATTAFDTERGGGASKAHSPPPLL
jgi:hypothetical protein